MKEPRFHGIVQAEARCCGHYRKADEAADYFGICGGGYGERGEAEQHHERNVRGGEREEDRHGDYVDPDWAREFVGATNTGRQREN